jgi:hypothetical protein
VTTPCEGEILLTATAGAFVDLGDRNAGSGVGARCSGARYDLRGDWSIALFVWNAPAVAADGDAVEFKVTTAAHHDGGFRTNAVTLVANDALSVGGAAPEVRSGYTGPIRPRRRGERRSLRTLPGASLRSSLAFNPRPRRLSTPPDAFQLHPD